MNTQPGDDDGVPGIVYVLHPEPAYRHASHHIGWTADVDVHAGATVRGSRTLERRLKRWHKTTQFCPTRRTRRSGRAR
jgi:hypothetical protein